MALQASGFDVAGDDSLSGLQLYVKVHASEALMCSVHAAIVDFLFLAFRVLHNVLRSQLRPLDSLRTKSSVFTLVVSTWIAW